MDPRIGTLNSGKFYAFIGGYDLSNMVESFDVKEVEAALNGTQYVAPKQEEQRLYGDYLPVTVREETFYYMQVFSDGSIYKSSVEAKNKTEARKLIMEDHKDTCHRSERMGYHLVWTNNAGDY